MSRNHTNTVRNLRESESVKLNKKIIKSGVYNQDSLVESIAESSQAISEKLANLQKYRTKTKKTLKENVNQVEWISEQSRLKKLYSKMESSISETLSMILLQQPNCEEIFELIDEMQILNNQRFEDHRTLTSQLHDIKEMMQSLSRVKRLKSHSKDGTVEVHDTTLAVFAGLLMQIKSNQSSSWHDLKMEEQAMTRSVQKDNRKISQMLREYELENQNQVLEKEFNFIVTEEGLEELLQKKGDSMEMVKPKLSPKASSNPPPPDKKHHNGMEVRTIADDLILHVFSKAMQKVIDPSDTTQLVEPSRPGDQTSSELSPPMQERLSSSRKKTSHLSMEYRLELVIAIKNWMRQIQDHDQGYEEKIRSKDIEKKLFCDEIGINYKDMRGGWDEASHDTLVKILRHAQHTGMIRKVMNELLTSQLPQLSMEAIQLHEEWYRKMQSIQKRYQDIEKVYRTTRSDLIDQAKVEIKALRDSLHEAMERDRVLSEHEIQRSLIHDRLVEMQRQRAMEDETMRLEMEKNRKVLEEKQLKALEDLEIERKERKQQAMEYRELKERDEMEKERIRLKEEEARREKLKELIELNRPNVEKRSQIIAEKEANKKLNELSMAQEEEKRMEVLMKLAQQVPYFEAIENAQPRLNHITAAVKAQEYVKDDDRFAYRGHIPLNGFTDQKVIQDSRFRLNEALRAAGLHQTSAAQSAVAKFFPRPQLAIHGIL